MKKIENNKYAIVEGSTYDDMSTIQTHGTHATHAQLEKSNDMANLPYLFQFVVNEGHFNCYKSCHVREI